MCIIVQKLLKTSRLYEIQTSEILNKSHTFIRVFNKPYLIGYTVHIEDVNTVLRAGSWRQKLSSSPWI